VDESSQISHVMHRLLGGGGGGKGDESDAGGSDVSVFAIVILTLGLILITEGVLHTLDYFAHERKFFRKTLTTCYRECKLMLLDSCPSHFPETLLIEVSVRFLTLNY